MSIAYRRRLPQILRIPHLREHEFGQIGARDTHPHFFIPRGNTPPLAAGMKADGLLLNCKIPRGLPRGGSFAIDNRRKYSRLLFTVCCRFIHLPFFCNNTLTSV
jgi:hypothetical protein